ncbi:MAG TPA: hypothetical protein VFZ00_20475, partial [Solirubrobacter sp.]|nr:hypothetical protein [Solirubrobacter sp.]
MSDERLSLSRESESQRAMPLQPPDHTTVLARINAELDEAIADRVAAHRERAAGTITVRAYLDRLEAARDVEDRLEPKRRVLGATTSRALELCERDGELTRFRHRGPLPERETDAAAVALHEARRVFAGRGLDLAVDDPPGELHGGGSGPCQPRFEYRTSKGIGVALQSPEGYAEDVRWHRWCAEHGYHPDDHAARDDAPPQPSHTREPFVWFSWARLRRLHVEDLARREAPAQLDLFTGA